MIKNFRKIIFIVITFIFVHCTTASGTNVTPPGSTVTQIPTLTSPIPPSEIKCNTGEELYMSKCVTICENGKLRNTEGVCSKLYNLKILLGDGSDISYSTVVGAGSIFTNNPPALSRIGYTFTHWLTNGTIVRPPFVMPEDDITLVAVWSIKSVKVSYNLDGGNSTTVLSATTYLYNSTITFASSPSRTGYKFEGWLANGVKYNSNSKYIIPGEDLTITAWWSAYYYNLTLNDLISPVSITSKTFNEATLLRNPNRNGYTFKAWTITGTDTSYAPGSSFTMPSKDVTLTAWWSINKYKLDVRSYDGSNLSTANYDYNSNYTIPNNSITRTGYTFTAWSGSNGMSYLPGATISFPASDLTLTSLWSINNYRLNFDLAGGVDPSTTFVAATLHFDYRYNFNNTPSRTGYTFVAWTIAGAGATQLFSSSFNIPAMDTILTAWWSINKYELSFNLNGGNSNDTFATRAYDYNSTVNLPIPSRTGYTFNGWQSNGTLVTNVFRIPSSPVNFSALWIFNTYTVILVPTFGMINGSTDNVTLTNVTYGSALPTPVLANYTFIGWQTIIGDINYYTTALAGNVTMIAAYSKTVDLNGNGLIDITNRDDLNKVRFNLAGTSLKESAADIRGAFGGCPNKLCRGYELKNDINLSGFDWTPIGGADTGTFTATFNGNGFEISHLTFKATRYDVGFFGKATGSTVRIESLGITHASIVQNDGLNPAYLPDNSQYAGILVGYFGNGTISNCYAKGIIIGKENTGGLVGYLDSANLINSYSISNVEILNDEIGGGGLIGTASNSTIINTYSQGTLKGSVVQVIVNPPFYDNQELTKFYGGLASRVLNSKFSNSYTSVLLDISSDGRYIGAIAGELTDSSNIMNTVFWDNTIFMNANGIIYNSTFNGQGLSTTNMQTTTSAITGLGNCFQLINGSYPKLYYSVNGVCTNTLMRGQ